MFVNKEFGWLWNTNTYQSRLCFNDCKGSWIFTIWLHLSCAANPRIAKCRWRRIEFAFHFAILSHSQLFPKSRNNFFSGGNSLTNYPVARLNRGPNPKNFKAVRIAISRPVDFAWRRWQASEADEKSEKGKNYLYKAETKNRALLGESLDIQVHLASRYLSL